MTVFSGVKRLLDDCHNVLPLGTLTPSGLLHPNSIKYGVLPLDFNNNLIISLSGSRDSRYCVKVISSILAPLNEMEPDTSLLSIEILGTVLF